MVLSTYKWTNPSLGFDLDSWCVYYTIKNTFSCSKRRQLFQPVQACCSLQHPVGFKHGHVVDEEEQPEADTDTSADVEHQPDVQDVDEEVVAEPELAEPELQAAEENAESSDDEEFVVVEQDELE